MGERLGRLAQMAVPTGLTAYGGLQAGATGGQIASFVGKQFGRWAMKEAMGEWRPETTAGKLGKAATQFVGGTALQDPSMARAGMWGAATTVTGAGWRALQKRKREARRREQEFIAGLPGPRRRGTPTYTASGAMGKPLGYTVTMR
jgi:hypothetical protein